MENKLDVLTKKLYEEGVDKANQEAEKIIANAKESAAKLVAEAEAKARDIMAAAESESESLKKSLNRNGVKCPSSYYSIETGCYRSYFRCGFRRNS